MKKLLAATTLVVSGGVLYWVYKDHSKTVDFGVNEVEAAHLSKLDNAYTPMIPPHPTLSQEGYYVPVTVNPNKYKSGILLSRTTDYYNPAQIYASTGPGNLAPFATGDTRNLDDGTKPREGLY